MANREKDGIRVHISAVAARAGTGQADVCVRVLDEWNADQEGLRVPYTAVAAGVVMGRVDVESAPSGLG